MPARARRMGNAVSETPTELYVRTVRKSTDDQVLLARADEVLKRQRHEPHCWWGECWCNGEFDPRLPDKE